MGRWWGKKGAMLCMNQNYVFRFGMLRDELKDQDIISSSRVA